MIVITYSDNDSEIEYSCKMFQRKIQILLCSGIVECSANSAMSSVCIGKLESQMRLNPVQNRLNRNFLGFLDHFIWTSKGFLCMKYLTAKENHEAKF